MAPSPTAAQTPASAPARRRGRPGHDREAVLRAAIDLFIEQGYDATSISDLAGSLGVTKSAVYHHFPSKESLLGAALDEALAAHPEDGDDDADDATAPAVAGPKTPSCAIG